MFFSILTASITLNWLWTSGLLVITAALGWMERRLLKSREDRINKWILLILYLVNFVILLAVFATLLWIWNWDVVTFITTTWDSSLLVIEQQVGQFIATVAVVMVMSFLVKVAKITFKGFGKKPGALQRRRETIGRLLTSVSTYTLVVIAVIIVLAIWGINVVPALAGLGIAGLVIGLGAQKFINDLISGFFIIFEHHFDVGDTIEVTGFKGTVIDIGLKTTRIKNWKGDIRIVANGEISSLINFSKDTSLAVVDFSIGYRENIREVIDLMTSELRVLKAHYSQILAHPEVAGVIALNASGIDLRITCLCESEKHYAVERAIRELVKSVCDSQGIEIPYPQVVVHQANK